MVKIKHKQLSKGNWEPSVSDGLNLPCSVCGVVPVFDYHIDDETWEKIAPKAHHLDVICLACLDKLASQKGINISGHLEFIDFCGKNKTIRLVPIEAYHYKENRRT